MNPLNQLPIDPAWVEMGNDIATDAAKRMGCMVLLIAVQPEGKLGIFREGVPESGDLHALAQDMPNMLAALASAIALCEEADKGLTRQ